MEISTTYSISGDDSSCLSCNKPKDKDSISHWKGWNLCKVCIEQFSDLLTNTVSTLAVNTKSSETVIVTPKSIVDYLDLHIVGQDEAKRTLALAAYQHFKKVGTKEKFNKSNVLLLGPTGSGKTALAEALAEYLQVPFVIQDAVQLTTQGYVGEDVEDILARLYDAAGQDIEKAQKGIVFLDEIDKIKHEPESRTGTHSLGVQRMLLKPLERATINVIPIGQSKTMGSPLQFDTTNVLFIAAGAFSDLPELINERLNKDKGSMGFKAIIKSTTDEKSSEYDDVIAQVKQEDLVTYGFMPEFLGRFPNITRTKLITQEVMRQILVEPVNSPVNQLTRLLQLDNIGLFITDEALDEISLRASKNQTGARALNGILNDVVKDAMFDYPSNLYAEEIVVDFYDGKFTADVIEGFTEVDADFGVGEEVCEYLQLRH